METQVSILQAVLAAATVGLLFWMMTRFAPHRDDDRYRPK